MRTPAIRVHGLGQARAALAALLARRPAAGMAAGMHARAGTGAAPAGGEAGGEKAGAGEAGAGGAGANAVPPPAMLVLLSAPGAAGYAGGRWFLRLAALAAAAERHACLWPSADPGRVTVRPVLDCGDAPGDALAALAAGADALVLDPACAAFPAVAAAARAAGAVLWTAPPPALDLGGLDLARPGGQARLAAWADAAWPGAISQRNRNDPSQQRRVTATSLSAKTSDQ
ncbi:hypothetical protein M0638_13560 [Roseomonas sp. NAR14]|uniref:Uncharacterized protein n=1 Tax=Roseomonas acroporae TaxID=2937791 RepID=A0A9X2BVS4_9PROT|nr:hypothetical protein [Roseomonas acroporae]MCK8785411.1 hypothetical protein [Roseomonas acroporae]